MIMRLCVQLNYIHAAFCRVYIFQATNNQQTKRKRAYAFAQSTGMFAVGITCTRFQIIAILLSFWTLTYRRFIYLSVVSNEKRRNEFVCGDYGDRNDGGLSVSNFTGHIY